MILHGQTRQYRVHNEQTSLLVQEKQNIGFEAPLIIIMFPRAAKFFECKPMNIGNIKAFFAVIVEGGPQMHMNIIKKKLTRRVQEGLQQCQMGIKNLDFRKLFYRGNPCQQTSKKISKLHPQSSNKIHFKQLRHHMHCPSSKAWQVRIQLYYILKDCLMNKPYDYDIRSLKYVAASFFATYFAGVVHPLDLIKTRFQSHDGKTSSENLVPKYTGVKNALNKIYKDEGFKGLYKGFYISLLCQATSMSFFFWEYETRKTLYEKDGYNTMDAVARASAEASILTTFITQPIWVIKTRMLLNTRKMGEFQNFKYQLKEIYSHYGVRGALKGLELSLILSLSGVIQMYVYEGSKILYDRIGIPQSPLGEKHFICGGLSKIFSIFMSYPITTLRTRIQQSQYINCTSSEKYKNLRHLASRTWNEEGVKGLYKGITANLMKGVSQKGIYFYLYEIFKDVLFPKKTAEAM